LTESHRPQDHEKPIPTKFAGFYFAKIGIRGTLSLIADRPKRPSGREGQQRERSGKIFFLGGQRNPLERHKTAKEIQGNQSLFL
jgi:hypothetical protein